jgi:small subunit ribosomal protein S11
MRSSGLTLALAVMACAQAAGRAGAQEFANFKDAAAAHSLPGGAGRAQGDVLESFVNGWAMGSLGIAFDYGNPARMVYFHEADPAPGIWLVNAVAPHSATVFIYSKLSGPGTDGGSVRMTDGFIYAADYNGDQVVIDDNIYLFDRIGNTVAWSSAGVLGFKGSRKSTPFAAQVAAEDAAKKAIAAGMKSVVVFIKGPGPGRESALRALQNTGFNVTSIKDVTPIPHNGCRPPKRRRV